MSRPTTLTGNNSFVSSSCVCCATRPNWDELTTIYTPTELHHFGTQLLCANPRKLLHRSIIFCQLEKRKSYSTVSAGYPGQVCTVSHEHALKRHNYTGVPSPGRPGCGLIRIFNLAFHNLETSQKNTYPRHWSNRKHIPKTTAREIPFMPHHIIVGSTPQPQHTFIHSPGVSLFSTVKIPRFQLGSNLFLIGIVENDSWHFSFLIGIVI